MTEYATSRAQAKELELDRYLTGKACPKGHNAFRYTSTSQCVTCLQGQKATPEQLAQSRERYAAKRALQPPKPAKPLTARQQAKAAGMVAFDGRICNICSATKRYTSNKQCVACSLALQKSPERAAAKRTWADANKSRITAQRAAQHAKDPGAASRRARVWAAANPEKRKVISLSYKARRRAQEAAGDSTAEITAWIVGAQKVCHWCGVPCENGYHVDHYTPLAKGGKHAVANLVISCGPCNVRKNAKDPYVFANSLGRLF